MQVVNTCRLHCLRSLVHALLDTYHLHILLHMFTTRPQIQAPPSTPAGSSSRSSNSRQSLQLRGCTLRASGTAVFCGNPAAQVDIRHTVIRVSPDTLSCPLPSVITTITTILTKCSSPYVETLAAQHLCLNTCFDASVLSIPSTAWTSAPGIIAARDQGSCSLHLPIHVVAAVHAGVCHWDLN